MLYRPKESKSTLRYLIFKDATNKRFPWVVRWEGGDLGFTLRRFAKEWIDHQSKTGPCFTVIRYTGATFMATKERWYKGWWHGKKVGRYGRCRESQYVIPGRYTLTRKARGIVHRTPYPEG